MENLKEVVGKYRARSIADVRVQEMASFSQQRSNCPEVSLLIYCVWLHSLILVICPGPVLTVIDRPISTSILSHLRSQQGAVVRSGWIQYSKEHNMSVLNYSTGNVYHP